MLNTKRNSAKENARQTDRQTGGLSNGNDRLTDKDEARTEDKIRPGKTEDKASSHE
jgi:hypothetical protein